MNTTLNGVANFNCTYVGFVSWWEANGSTIYKYTNGFTITDTELLQGLHLTTLSVDTSQDKNNTSITCNAVDQGSKTIERKTALLLLQGKHQLL